MQVIPAASLAKMLKAVRKPGPTGKGKRKTQKVEQLRVVSKEALDQYNEANLDYISCVLRPDLYTAKIPSPFPVPSHVCQSKGTIYVNANATGNLGIVLAPSNLATMITVVNGPTLGEGVVWNTATSASSTPASINGYSAKARVVGAWIKAECLEPDLTRKGVISAGFLPYNPMQSPSGTTFTNDSLRDQPGVATYNASQVAKCWARYIPLDPADLTFDTNYSNQDSTCVWSLSGGPANTQVAITYRVVHEIIPLPSQTDLLCPTLGDIGDPVAVIKMAANAATCGSSQFPGGAEIGQFKDAVLQAAAGKVVGKVAESVGSAARFMKGKLFGKKV